MNNAEHLFERARSGDRASLSKAMTEIEYLTQTGRELLTMVVDAEPRIIGWTGGPGAGKSSLIAALLPERVRVLKEKVAVLAVDPTSPFSGGSVLGDRIRMDALTLEDLIYIRSLPSRIRQSALAPATMRLARFLAGVGFAEVHVETVGVGQSDIEIAELSETTVVVVAPHGGDTVQGMKAGLMEIADVFAVSKGDVEAARSMVLNLESAIRTGRANWTSPILLTSAKSGMGVEELSSILDRHLTVLTDSGERSKLFRERRFSEFRTAVHLGLEESFFSGEAFEETGRAIRAGEMDPVAAAEELLRTIEEARK